jgi:hypothetical protein
VAAVLYLRELSVSCKYKYCAIHTTLGNGVVAVALYLRVLSVSCKYKYCAIHTVQL